MIRHLTILLSLAILWPFSAMAQLGSPPKVEVELVAPVEAVQPGQTVEIGLLQQIEPGWHTYWQNPGDSGQATSIEWRLPEGVTAGEILWPAPQRLPYFDMVNYGYKDEVLLASEITVPESWPVGEPVLIQAIADWLVCADICIPETAELSLKLPTGNASVGPGDHASLFEASTQLRPGEAPWPALAHKGPQALQIVADEDFSDRELQDAYWFPLAGGIIDHAAPQSFEANNGRLLVNVSLKDQAIDQANGVLVVNELVDGEPMVSAYTIGTAITPMPAQFSPAAQGVDVGFISALLLALIGGVILNLMPCVFPVLSLKAVGLVSGAHDGRRELALHGFAYTAGILVTFAAIAIAMWGAQLLGHEVGWGVQLQSPVFVTILAYLLLALGLSLSGVFEIGTSLMGAGQEFTNRSGYVGSFAVGLLAVIVATPCVAPFMGVALSYALAQPLAISLAVFLALGLGLALPFLLLSLTPSLARLLPRPGPWMERLKQVLAFPLYASAAWLIWVLSFQVSSEALLATLIGAVLIGMAAWLKGVFDGSTGTRSRWVTGSLAIFAVIVGLGLAIGSERSSQASGDYSVLADDDLAQPYDPELMASLRAGGDPVLINLTAAWCITCQVNDRVALKGDTFAEALEQNGVTYFKGDWTNGDPAITDLLSKYGRNGVPLYLVYPRGQGDAEILPQILTQSMVLDALQRAG